MSVRVTIDVFKAVALVDDLHAASGVGARSPFQRWPLRTKQVGFSSTDVTNLGFDCRDPLHLTNVLPLEAISFFCDATSTFAFNADEEP